MDKRRKSGDSFDFNKFGLPILTVPIPKETSSNNQENSANIDETSNDPSNNQSNNSSKEEKNQA